LVNADRNNAPNPPTELSSTERYNSLPTTETSLLHNLSLPPSHNFITEFVTTSKPSTDFTATSAVLYALCKNNHVDKTIDLLRKIKEKGIQPDAYTHTILTNGLCKDGRLEEAREVFPDL
jgi:pentatricopeptide repeat protein